MDLDEAPDSLNNNELRDYIDQESHTHTFLSGN